MKREVLKRPAHLKPYRSQAEWIRVWQTWFLIFVAIGSWLTNLLVALKVFGIIK